MLSDACWSDDGSDRTQTAGFARKGHRLQIPTACTFPVTSTVPALTQTSMQRAWLGRSCRCQWSPIEESFVSSDSCQASYRNLSLRAVCANMVGNTLSPMSARKMSYSRRTASCKMPMSARKLQYSRRTALSASCETSLELSAASLASKKKADGTKLFSIT